MALPAKPFRFSAVFAGAVAGVTAVNAQSLNQPSPLDRLSDVVQFGVPRDTQFVFCDGEDCPERSIKHLYVLPPPPPPVQEPVMPAPQSIQPSEELSHAKVPAKKKRKKSAIQYECKPVTKAK
ncbi:hypothetical protein D5039_21820 [Verminephrobacter aporrectodeae subsp. tuberculatae]|uniref:Uncharacterized protein n=1 Tax=Verminephrobacter aporrectodeae subsp. tuberculatae TaxID=1110392 RepID=A0ABT3KZB4_9BURK|nr:hypothetical protein [Verminephrobacter aporrectodeae]MCW5323683.1 hypothetical protein [Verminephrobacter aporrectodeae subsp. tuberculatae]